MNNYIDSTNLKPYATIEDITKLCGDALKYHFQTVCVHPYYVSLAKSLLEDSTVQVTSVVGFPLGMNSTSVKVYEAVEALENGADEIDMVINIGALKDEEYECVKKEIEEIRNILDGKVLKVIIETCYLTDEEIIKMTNICNETFVNYIKTSTGYGTKGADEKDIKLINKHKNDILEIKASGNINDIKDANKMINAGAARIGTSHAKEIMEGDINDNI